MTTHARFSTPRVFVSWDHSIRLDGGDRDRIVEFDDLRGVDIVETLDNAVALANRLNEDDRLRFHFTHGGYAYQPDENRVEARERCARERAIAEIKAELFGWTVEWERDPDGEFMDDGTEWGDWPHYQAVLRSADGEHLASLGGVMFADRGDETSDPYSRVVEAELAEEAIDRLDHERRHAYPRGVETMTGRVLWP